MKKLHDLIQSLSQGEKRYVKIRLNANKSSSLLNIYFNSLSRQKNYSFEELQKLGKQSTKNTQSNLSLLFDVVLKHLSVQYTSKNIENGMRGDLSRIKILMDKGFLAEAKSLCKKLIQKAKDNEEFEVLKTAYKEYWNIHLLNGELNDESSFLIQTEIRSTGEKELEISDLEDRYRMVTTLYYSYFFKKRDPKNIKDIKKITQQVEPMVLKSDKALHIYYEIKAISVVVNNDLENHHLIRKNQLKHLIKSQVFESEHLLRLMVLSNTFTFLRSQSLINELAAYVGFMEEYFKPVIENGGDGMFSEKYCDIYFTNQCFIQSWAPDENKIGGLLDLFKQVISKGQISNSLIVGRIYLSLIELEIINENYKSTGPLLTEFFNLSKKKKYSKHYMEGDLLYLIENYLQGKMDTFDNSLESFNRKVRRNDIELDPDQKILQELLNDIFNERRKETEYYLKNLSNKQTYKLFVYKMLGSNSFSDIRSKHFPINDPNYNPILDDYLASLKSNEKRFELV